MAGRPGRLGHPPSPAPCLTWLAAVRASSPPPWRHSAGPCLRPPAGCCPCQAEPPAPPAAPFRQCTSQTSISRQCGCEATSPSITNSSCRARGGRPGASGWVGVSVRQQDDAARWDSDRLNQVEVCLGQLRSCACFHGLPSIRTPILVLRHPAAAACTQASCSAGPVKSSNPHLLVNVVGILPALDAQRLLHLAGKPHPHLRHQQAVWSGWAAASPPAEPTLLGDVSIQPWCTQAEQSAATCAPVP